MKRAALLVLLVLAVGLAGAAVGRKFPYLSDKLNRKVKLTEIELACIKSGFRARAPLVLLKDRLLATAIDAVPQASNIRLTVRVQPHAKSGKAPAGAELEAACATAYTHWRRNLLRRTIPDTNKCPVTVDLLIGSKVIYREIRDSNGRRGFENPSL